MGDFIERQKNSNDTFLSQLYEECERRANLFAQGDPEAKIKQFNGKDLIFSTVIMLIITLYFILMLFYL